MKNDMTIATVKPEISPINEDLLKPRIFAIRGVKKCELYLTEICKLCIL